MFGITYSKSWSVLRNSISILYTELHEWQLSISFSDFKPASRIHQLIIPKVHLTDALELDKSNLDLLQVRFHGQIRHRP